MNKLNLSFIMSSYGDDLRCKDVHASASVDAASVKATSAMHVPLLASHTDKEASPPKGSICFVITEAAADNADDNTLQVYDGAWKKVTVAALT